MRAAYMEDVISSLLKGATLSLELPAFAHSLGDKYCLGRKRLLQKYSCAEVFARTLNCKL